MLKKGLKYLLITLLLLAIVVVVGSYYVLNTNSGLKQAISLANRYSGYDVHAATIEGDMLGRAELTQFQIKGKDLDFSSERVVLDWQSKSLLDKSLVVNAIIIDNATVMVSPPKKKKPQQPDQPFSLSDIGLPIDIQLKDLLITNLLIKNPVNVNDSTSSEAQTSKARGDMLIDKIHLGVDYVGQKGTIRTLEFQGFDTQLNLTGEVLTKGNFPIHLHSDADYNRRNLAEVLNVIIDGALKDTLTIDVSGTGLGDFELDGKLSSLFDTPAFVAKLALKKIDDTALGMVDTRLSADLDLKGKLGETPALNANGEVFYDSPDTDRLKLTLDGEFDGERAELSAFTLDLLAAKQQLTGLGSYVVSDKRIDVTFSSDALHWPQQDKNPSVTLKDTLATITGSLDDYQLTIKTQGNTQAVGAIDLHISGRGNTTALTQFDAKGLLNEQPITLTGHANWSPTVAYEANLNADKITPFNQLPGVEHLNIDIKGNDKTYTANGGVYVYRNDIPPSDIHLSVSGTPSDLDHADVTIKTLGGEVLATATGKLSPLNIVGNVQSKNLQPQTFYPDVQGTLNHQLHITAKQHGETINAEAVIEELSGQWQGYPLAGSGKVRFDQGANRLTIDALALNLAGNRLNADGVLMLDAQQSTSDLSATIDAKHLNRLLPDLSGAVSADIVAKGNVKTPEFKANIDASNVVYQAQHIDKITVLATILADTASNNITADGSVVVNSPTTDQLKLTVNGEFDGDRVTLSEVVVDLLTAKQQLTGNGHFTLSDETLALTLASQALHWPQAATEPAVALSKTQLSLTGALSDYHLEASTHVATPAVGEVPVIVRADGDVSSLKHFQADAKLNNQPITLNGKAAWAPKLDYQVFVQADEITPYQQVPGVKNLAIDVSGDDSTYRADGKVSVYADNIPPSAINLAVQGTPSKLNDAKLTIDTLGGTLVVDAKGGISPLDIVANVSSKTIQPQQFYPDINANINSQLVITATQHGDNVNAEAIIKQLTGTLQQYPLAGSGTVRFDQGEHQVTVNGLAVNLAGNKVKADGTLVLDKQHGQSNLKANIDAPQLKRLLPDLGGAVKGDVIVRGNLNQPAIKAKLNGHHIAYQTNKVKQIDVNAEIDLASESIAFTANADGVQSGDNVIDKATAAINGKLGAHTLSLDVDTAKTSAIPSIKLAGKGGLDRNRMAWSGKVGILNLDNEMLGKWRLAQPTPLVLSADNVSIKKLCLTQQATSLCTEGQLNGSNGGFDVVLQSLPTKVFKHLMPETVDIDTSISGKARIDLKHGKPNVTGKLSADGGRLKLNAGSGVLTSRIKQLDTGFSLKNNRFKGLVKSDLSKIGKIDVVAELADISKGNLKANIKIDNQSLKFVEEIVPQLTDVSGRMTGDMALSGNPSKSLSVAGKITLQKTDFNVPQFGSEIRGLTLDIFAKNGNKVGFKGSARAGEGNFNIDGEINPATQRGNVNLQGKNFQVANSNKLQVAISPDIQVVFADHIQVRGEVLIPKALVVPESTGSKVTVSEDVILPNDASQKKQSANSPIDVEVTVKLGDDVRVASADIETRLNGSIKVNAKPGKVPKAAGAIEVETGELRIYGQMLTIERGRIIFSNGPIANPSLDIRTTRKIESDEVTVGANVLGTVKSPEVSLFSTPSMADSSILSYLLFGRPPNSDSFGTTALLQTGGLIGANSMARDVRASLGLDVLDFSLTGMEAGKNLTKKLYVGMRSNFFDAINQFLANYKISGRTKIESAISTEGLSVDLIKVIETN